MADQQDAEIAKSQRLEPRTVYAVIQQEGEKELERPASSLWWSGFAAGLAISSSVVAQGVLHNILPDSSWRLPIESAGYCIGFMIVILGRLQLFTENTITPVLPIMADYSSKTLGLMFRLWAIVLAANLSGTLAAAMFAKATGFAAPLQLEAYYAVAQHAVLGKTAMGVLVQAIPAGFFVAALVWTLPSSKGFEIWVILVITYLIAAGGFAHVVVGSTEVFLLLVDGQIGLGYAFGTYLLPALCGNVIGGTVLFSLLAYAQVREEID